MTAPKTPKIPAAPRVTLSDRAKTVLAPWGVCLCAMPTALATHAAWGSDAVMQDAVAAGAVVLAGVVHQTWSHRHERTRTLATVFSGALGAWVALGTSVDPLSHGMVNAWAFGGVMLSLVWNVRDFGHAGAHETDKATGQRDGLLERVGGMLSGARTRAVKETPGRVEAEVQLKPGTTADDARTERGRIASLAQLGPDQVTMADVPGRADKVVIAFQDNPEQRDTVRGYVPGPLGRSVADAPLVFGRRSDGKDMALWMVGDPSIDNPRQLGHTLCTGMNGSGKTNTIRLVIAGIRETRDMVPIVADPAKFGQSFGDMERALGFAVKTKAHTMRLIANLPGTIAYRADLLGSLTRADGSTGYEQWEPECWDLHNVPAIFLDIEEASDVLKIVDDDYDEAVRKARSVGIHLCASLQTAIYTNIDRKTRGQFANSMCHGTKEIADARFTLNTRTLEAGADPTRWQNNYPGSLYAELVGVPPEEWAVEGRAYGVTRAEMAAMLKASQPTWAVLDPGTLEHLSRGITAAPAAPQPAQVPSPRKSPEAVAQAAPATPQETDDEGDEGGWEDGTGQPADLTRVVVDGPDGFEVVDLTEPLTPPSADAPAISLVPLRTGPVDYDAAFDLLRARLDALEAAGESEVPASAFADLPVLTGVSRPWVFKKLDQLVQDGRLSRVTEPGQRGVLFRIRRSVVNGAPYGA